MTDIFAKLKLLREQENAAVGQPEWLIVGLGNPGRQYEYTRHNSGFLAVDRLAGRLGVRVDRLRFKGLTGVAKLCGKTVLLLKPQTYMNNSGESVHEAMDFYKIPPERTLLLFDDISLPVGTLRVRRKGSDGGHNGLKSIFLLSGADAFPRVKIGIGTKPHPDFELADWVLSHFSEDEGKLLDPALTYAGEAAELIVQGRFDEAMNGFNHAPDADKPKKPAPPKPRKPETSAPEADDARTDGETK